jgi:mxaJ protein
MSRQRLRLAAAAFWIASGFPGTGAVGGSQALPPAARGPLRVCADPNNLPFSNSRLEGFENRLAAMAATTLGTRADFVWWPQRRGFVRMTLNTGECDVIMGVPAAFELARTTRPYYRAGYVFVQRIRRGDPLVSLDDPRLHRLRVGVQMVGDDFANSPPAHALSARGIVRNVVGFSVLGDYSQPNPPARIIEAVAGGRIDVAIAWGPLAGYFAHASKVPLTLQPVTPALDPPSLPFEFDISMAVRRNDESLARSLDAFIVRYRADIEKLLNQFHVPHTRQTRGHP